MNVTCAVCGKNFEAATRNQKYCSRKCYKYAQRHLEILRRCGRKKEVVIHTYKAWDPKDPECREVYFLIRTFKPIDWSEVYAVKRR